MIAMPRSGASYHFTGRGLSPIFGVMEGWRSVITNPVFRGTGSFFAVQIFAGGLFVIGNANNDAGLIAAATALNDPVILFIAAFAMILVGFVFSYLSVKWLGWFVIILGIINIASLLVGDLVLLMTPMTDTIWDGVFGAGSYAAVNSTIAPADLAAYTTFNAGAVGPALIVTVGMMWPYLIMPVAGEVSQPSKNIPLSNVGGWAGIAAFFLLSGFALEASMGSFLYQANTAFTFFPGFGNYAAVILGASPLAWFVIMGPIFASVLDSPSNALWVTRPMHSMAMDRFCPEAFARVHPKYHVPHITLYFC